MVNDKSITSTNQQEQQLHALATVEYSKAKLIKKQYWFIEVVALSLSVFGGLLHFPAISIVTSIAGAVAKAFSKHWLSQAKSAFRRAERARRWHFERLTLGWPLPPQEVEDLLLEFSSETRAKANELRQQIDDDYYSRKGPPGTRRLFLNLAESAYWTERMFEAMAKRRQKAFRWAIVALIFTFAGAYLGISSNSAATFFKIVAAGTAFLVSVDIYGEQSSFARGAKYARDLRLALLSQKISSANHHDCLRLFVEYNCMLVEMPLVPDEVRDKCRTELEESWRRIEESLETETDRIVSGPAEGLV